MFVDHFKPPALVNRVNPWNFLRVEAFA